MDYSQKRKGLEEYASFLPALSTFYSETLSRAQRTAGYFAAERIPKGMEKGLDGLNFLDKENSYFYYDRCLYSAGHAKLDIAKSIEYDGMVQKRDRSSVTVVSDSGGFQIGKGVIKFDWDHFYEKKGDAGYIGDADALRLKIINWQEYTAQWSMTLDVPTWCVNNPATGLKTYDDCLNATLFNLDFFMANKQGNTKWLNVLQGTEWEDATRWYDAVKGYDTQGWAFGSNNARDLEIALRRIIVMRDEGLLQDRDWIHVLGTSKLEWAVVLTATQRAIRQHINPNLTISFDCASPFIATANALVYTYNIHTPERFSYIMDSCFDEKHLKGSNLPFPFESEMGKRLNAGDICIYGNAHALINGVQDTTVTKEEVDQLIASGVDASWVPADLNKIGKEGRTSWDVLSYELLMNHNVEMHIKAVMRANQLADIEYAAHKPEWRKWSKSKRSEKSKELSNWVPKDVLYVMSFIEELFVSDDPHGLLDSAKELLAQLRNGRHSVSGTSSSTFGSLFDEEITTKTVSSGTFDELDPNSKEVAALDDLENNLED